MKIYILYRESGAWPVIAAFSDKESARKEAEYRELDVEELELDPPVTFPDGLKPFTVSCNQEGRPLDLWQHVSGQDRADTEIADLGIMTDEPLFSCIVMALSKEDAISRFSAKWKQFESSGGLNKFKAMFEHPISVEARMREKDSLEYAMAVIGGARARRVGL